MFLFSVGGHSGPLPADSGTDGQVPPRLQFRSKNNSVQNWTEYYNFFLFILSTALLISKFLVYFLNWFSNEGVVRLLWYFLISNTVVTILSDNFKTHG